MEQKTKERITGRVKAGRLIARQRMGLLTPGEAKRLEAWLAKDEKHRRLHERLSQEEILPRIAPAEGEKSWKQFIRRYPVYPRLGRRRWAAWLSAACCLLFAAGVAWLWQPDKEEERILPPRPADNVRLVFGDGQSVTLDEADPAELARIDGADVKPRARSIDYSAKGTAKDTAAEYHTIIVPKYGEYTVRLADNSVVKLNSESTLRYPVAFQGKTREVWLTGEAYLEVASDPARCFKVHTGETTVSVLGTTFNVANTPDGETVTTLVSGRVSVDNGRANCVISPGQQAVTRQDSEAIDVRKADIAAATAWTRDMFYFNEEPLETIMETLSRWYEFGVVFENEAARQRRFTVESSRYENIDQILTLIEETGVVTCRKEGRTIHIR